MKAGAFVASLLLAALGSAAADVTEWAGYGAAYGCVKWSDACWRHYGVHVEHAWRFGTMLSTAAAKHAAIYVPGGWHPEEAWPADWKTRLLQLPYLRYLGVCAGSFAFALGGATYYTNAGKWPPADAWTNGITAAWGMLGPNIWAPYRTYVLGKASGHVVYWNGPLFAPEPGKDVILIGPCIKVGKDGVHVIEPRTPTFIRRVGDTVWAWVLDLKVRIHGIEGYGCALGIIYEIVQLPEGVKLVEKGRVALFGPHPEFRYATWWMLKRAYDFVRGDWTPDEFNAVRETALLLIKYGQLRG